MEVSDKPLEVSANQAKVVHAEAPTLAEIPVNGHQIKPEPEPTSQQTSSEPLASAIATPTGEAATTLVDQGKGSTSPSVVGSGLEEGDEEEEAINSGIDENVKKSMTTEERLKTIQDEQSVLSAQYSYLAYTLSRALEARLSQTLRKMDEASKTGIDPPQLSKIYEAHVARVQSGHKDASVVKATRKYQLDEYQTLSEKNVAIIWGDYYKQKMDLIVQMNNCIAKKMIDLTQEKNNMHIGQVRIMDWISNNLDVVHDLGSRPKLSTLTSAEVKNDLVLLKNSFVIEEKQDDKGLEEYDFLEDPADSLYHLADIAEQQPLQSAQPLPIKQEFPQAAAQIHIHPAEMATQSSAVPPVIGQQPASLAPPKIQLQPPSTNGRRPRSRSQHSRSRSRSKSRGVRTSPASKRHKSGSISNIPQPAIGKSPYAIPLNLHNHPRQPSGHGMEISPQIGYQGVRGMMGMQQPPQPPQPPQQMPSMTPIQHLQHLGQGYQEAAMQQVPGQQYIMPQPQYGLTAMYDTNNNLILMQNQWGYRDAKGAQLPISQPPKTGMQLPQGFARGVIPAYGQYYYTPDGQPYYQQGYDERQMYYNANGYGG